MATDLQRNKTARNNPQIQPTITSKIELKLSSQEGGRILKPECLWNKNGSRKETPHGGDLLLKLKKEEVGILRQKLSGTIGKPLLPILGFSVESAGNQSW